MKSHGRDRGIRDNAEIEFSHKKIYKYEKSLSVQRSVSKSTSSRSTG